MDTSNFAPIRSAEVEPPDSKKINFKFSKIQPIAFVLGLGLLAFILYRVGFQTVLNTISRVGFGFIFIACLNGSRHFLRALCLFLAVGEPEKFKYSDAVVTRLGGEAVGILTFTGAMASETTKTALLKTKLPLSKSLATIVVDNMIYAVSVGLFILSGVLVMFSTFGSGDGSLKITLIVISVLMFLGVSGFILMALYKFKPMTFLLKRFSDSKFFPKFIYKRREKFFNLENEVLSFYLNHRSRFIALFSLNFLAHTLSVVEVYLGLYLLEVTPSAATSYIIESLTKTINFMFSFIPGNLGVNEGGAAVIFLTLGYASATGVALALVRRGATLFWTAIGVITLFWRGIWSFSDKENITE
jgi:glycosyltransferase 2 family protein